MTTIFLRTLFIYITLIIVMRLMGKRQIGELEVTDLVTTLLVSEIASLPLTNVDLPISHAVVPILILLTLEVFSSVLLIRFPRLKGLVSAQPTVIIQDGVLIQGALKNLRISLEELMSEIRQQGLTDLSQVQYAILEKNGKLTVLPKAAFTPPDASTLGVKPKEVTLMHIVYCNHSFSKEGLRLIGKEQGWVERALQKRGVELRDLLFVSADCKGNLYFVKREEQE